MRFKQARISMWQSMVLVAVFAFGLAISPPGAPYLALLLPVALGLATLRLWPIAVPALIALAVCAVCEFLLEISIPGWIYVPIAILISGPLWPEGQERWRWRRWIKLIAVNALILALFLIPWTSRKMFLRDLSSIKPGMTGAEVARVMAPYSEQFESMQPHPDRMHYILFPFHAHHWLINKNWGMVKMRDGEVVEVGFWPHPY
jgi:hypothetical protein